MEFRIILTECIATGKVIDPDKHIDMVEDCEVHNIEEMYKLLKSKQFIFVQDHKNQIAIINTAMVVSVNPILYNV